MRITIWQTLASAALVAAVVAIPAYRTKQVAHAEGEKKAARYTTWSDYLGNADSEQYSALKQINRTNVSQLQQVWFYAAGDNASRYGFNPLVVGNTMIAIPAEQHRRARCYDRQGVVDA